MPRDDSTFLNRENPPPWQRRGSADGGGGMDNMIMLGDGGGVIPDMDRLYQDVIAEDCADYIR